MELQELKNKIAVVESAENNISLWSNLQDRELAIIPTDSNYYKEFKQWLKAQKPRYDGEKECAPLYVSRIRANDVVAIQVKAQEDFMKPHKEFLDKLLLSNK